MDIGQRLLFFRPRPQPDELLTSWLVRLAWANRQKLEPFTREHFGRDALKWMIDLDRTPPVRMLAGLNRLTGVPRRRIWDTTLPAYEGVLFERAARSGQLAWVLPIGKTSRLAKRSFTSYCPICLATDEVPYFRREWRLAWAVACPIHGCLMADCCAACGANAAFHQCDYGHTLTPPFDRLRACWRCGRPLGNDFTRSQAPADLLWLVRVLDQAITLGIPAISTEFPLSIAHPLSLFVGLHILVAAISSNARTMPLREGMRSHAGCPNVTMPDKHGRPFEEWGIQDRANLILLAGWLLRDWPARFISSCQAADIMGSSFRRYEWTSELPFWFESALKEGIDRPWYRVTAAEVDAARAYLLRRWLKPSEFALRALLGHTTSNPRA